MLPGNMAKTGSIMTDNVHKNKTQPTQESTKDTSSPPLMNKISSIIASKKTSKMNTLKELSRAQQAQLELNEYIQNYVKQTNDIEKAISLSKKANICIENKNFVYWAKN